jgi:CheY-like chemotaxis protein
MASIHWQHLEDLLQGNSVKTKEIAEYFIQETPKSVAMIKTFIQNERWHQVAAVVHRIKVRFGYFGEDALVQRMVEWELRLRTEMKFDKESEMQMANTLETKTNEIAAQLSRDLPEQKNALQQNPLQGKTVLIAEDDEINAMVFELFVKELGGDVIKVTDGNQAVATAVDKLPNLIFMDIHMPFFSGIEAIKSIRSKNIDCPIIALSASTRLNERQNSLDAGANDFLVKPAKRDSINYVLLKYLAAPAV